MSDCIFCKIVRGELPARVSYQDDDVLAFDDIQPAAPVHVLVVPRRHMATLNEAVPADAALLGKLLTVAAQVARERGVAESGWRVAINVGRDANQVVQHVHLHLLGGRALRPSPA